MVRFWIDLRHLLISDQKNVPTRLCYKSSSPNSVRNCIEVWSWRGDSIAHTWHEGVTILLINSVEENTELPYECQAILLAELELFGWLNTKVLQTYRDTFPLALSKHTQVIVNLWVLTLVKIGLFIKVLSQGARYFCHPCHLVKETGQDEVSEDDTAPVSLSVVIHLDRDVFQRWCVGALTIIGTGAKNYLLHLN